MIVIDLNENSLARRRVGAEVYVSMKRTALYALIILFGVAVPTLRVCLRISRDNFVVAFFSSLKSKFERVLHPRNLVPARVQVDIVYEKAFGGFSYSGLVRIRCYSYGYG